MKGGVVATVRYAQPTILHTLVRQTLITTCGNVVRLLCCARLMRALRVGALRCSAVLRRPSLLPCAHTGLPCSSGTY